MSGLVPDMGWILTPGMLVVGRNFEDVVLQKDKDVMLLVFPLEQFII